MQPKLYGQFLLKFFLKWGWFQEGIRAVFFWEASHASHDVETHTTQLLCGVGWSGIDRIQWNGMEVRNLLEATYSHPIFESTGQLLKPSMTFPIMVWQQLGGQWSPFTEQSTGAGWAPHTLYPLNPNCYPVWKCTYIKSKPCVIWYLLSYRR